MKGIPAFDRLKLRGKMILIYFLAVFLPIALIGGMLILRTQSMERAPWWKRRRRSGIRCWS